MDETPVYGNASTYRPGVRGWAWFVGLGVGMSWGLLSVWSGWRLAWLALGVGVLIGWLWRPAAVRPTRRTALGAAVLLLVSAAVAWGTSRQVGGKLVSGAEMRDDPGLVQLAVEDWMAENGELPDPTADAPEAIDSEEPAEPADAPADGAPPNPTAGVAPEVEVEAVLPPMRPEEIVRLRIAKMDDEQLRDVVARYLRQPGGQSVRRTQIARGWRLVDLLWVAAGGWIAYRLASIEAGDEAD